MVRVTRRRALHLGAVATLAAGAGCLNPLADDSNDLRVTQIDVTNYDATVRTIHVLLTESGEPVYYNSGELAAWDAQEGRGSGVRIWEDLPDDPGQYTLYVWRDQQPRQQWIAFDLNEETGDISCTTIIVDIGKTEQATAGEIFVSHSLGCQDERRSG